MIDRSLSCATVVLVIFASKDTARQNKVVDAQKMASSGVLFMSDSTEET
jgi:hypothetical protein